jgi:hypothetical protein
MPCHYGARRFSWDAATEDKLATCGVTVCTAFAKEGVVRNGAHAPPLPCRTFGGSGKGYGDACVAGRRLWRFWRNGYNAAADQQGQGGVPPHASTFGALALSSVTLLLWNSRTLPSCRVRPLGEWIVYG